MAVVAMVGGCLLLLLGCFVWAMTTGRIADTKLLPGNKLPPSVTRQVSTSAKLKPGEQVLYFYSTAMTPTGDGNILTNRRVISYVDDGTNAWVSSIALDSVASFDFDRSDSWLEDSVLTVIAEDGTQLVLYLSIEGDGDIRFVDALRSSTGLTGTDNLDVAPE